MSTEFQKWAAKWATGRVTCEKCGYKWVAVWPIKTKRLKCPECGRMGVRFNKRKEDSDAE